MHYYQFHIGDYQSDTRHLELMEDLAYRRMLDLYYKNENQLPIDVAEIARLIGMRSHSECIEIVLHDFFERTDQGWRNNKADEVLAATYSKSESARKSAKARWSKKDEEKQQVNANAMRTQCESDANGMLPITHYPLPITQLNTSQPDKPTDKASATKARKREQAITLMTLWNNTKDQAGTNWTSVMDPCNTSAKRFTAATARIEWVQKRLAGLGKPNDWDSVVDWFTKLYLSMASDPFYAGNPNETNPRGYKSVFEQVHAEEYFVKMVERLNEGWMK